MDRAGAPGGAFRGGPPGSSAALSPQPGERKLSVPSLETYSRHPLEKVCFRTLLWLLRPRGGGTEQRPTKATGI